MTDRTNRRDLMVDVAGRLFIGQGYSATSIRQIADEVGCTEAAIYYHFKDGKRELFQAVVEGHMPDLLSVLEECRQATSLHDLIVQFGHSMQRVAAPRVGRFRWLIAEFPNLSEEERGLFLRKHTAFQQGLTALVSQFVEAEDRANAIAWTLICAGFGYGQLYYNLGVASVSDFTAGDLTALLADALSAIDAGA